MRTIFWWKSRGMFPCLYNSFSSKNDSKPREILQYGRNEIDANCELSNNYESLDLTHVLYDGQVQENKVILVLYSPFFKQ